MTRFILELTNSQRMALTDALLDYLRTPNSIEVFHNCSTDPAEETTLGELIRLITTVRPVREQADAGATLTPETPATPEPGKVPSGDSGAA